MIHPKRVKCLRSGSFSGKAVLYWMVREKRINDNWSMSVAQEIALKNKVPLYVCFQYLGNFPKSNIRQYNFLFKGFRGSNFLFIGEGVTHLVRGIREAFFFW